MYHALALFACAWAQERWGSPLFGYAAWLFVAGALGFSVVPHTPFPTGGPWGGAVGPPGVGGVL